MKIGYIKESDITCDVIKRIILAIKRFFNIIDIKKNDNKVFVILPITNTSKLKKYRISKLCKKINRILYKEDIENVVLSNYLEKYELLKIKLYCENINILDGRYLFKCLSYKIIEYIFKKQKSKIELRGSYYIVKQFG